ncbi:MAG: GNAT family N-acetyltransferase [Ornithinimicrobium sp.]
MSKHGPYRWAALRPADVTQWALLIEALARADDTDEHYGPQDLAEELQQHGVDPQLDTVAVWDGSSLIGFAQVKASHTVDADGLVRVWLSGGVHPDYRGQGIGRRLFEISEERGAALAHERHPGSGAFWRADGNLEGASVRPLLEHRGYHIVRYFNQMKRPIPGPVASLRTPAGAVIRTPTAEHCEPLREIHNLAFRDHWGSSEITRNGWLDHWNSVSGRLSLSSVALDEDGAPLAYALCGQHAEGTLYVNIVGTHPRARGRGLAHACLNHTIALAAADGSYEEIELHVDSDSPTGATRLYERLGFSQGRVFAAYQRPIGAH